MKTASLLNVSSYGDTPEAALKALQEVVGLFLKECQAMGTLEVILEEAGYHSELPDQVQPDMAAYEHIGELPAEQKGSPQAVLQLAGTLSGEEADAILQAGQAI